MHFTKIFPARFLNRQYLYAVLCAALILLLIKWNLSITSHERGELKPSAIIFTEPTQTLLPPVNNRLKNADSRKRIEEEVNTSDKADVKSVEDGDSSLKRVQSLEEKAKEVVLQKPKGNTVSVTVYMESQCPDTTGFIKRQLVPTFEKLQSAERINFTIVPFGKAHCERKDDNYFCECQHGPVECQLNELMNCVIDRFPAQKDHISIIGCIQGQSSLMSAIQSCLLSSTELDWLKTCSTGRRGHFLHALAGEKTAKIGPDFNFVPWVVIGDKRVNDAFYALEENVCQRLDAPKPVQCEHFL